MPDPELHLTAQGTAGRLIDAARLMAAAPMLLAQLEASTKELIAERDAFYYSVSTPCGEVDDREILAKIDALIDSNRALIAKAEGSGE